MSSYTPVLLQVETGRLGPFPIALTNAGGVALTSATINGIDVSADLDQPVKTTSSPTFVDLTLSNAAVDNVSTSLVSINGGGNLGINTNAIPLVVAHTGQIAGLNTTVGAHTTSINAINATLAADLDQAVKTTSFVQFAGLNLPPLVDNAQTNFLSLNGTNGVVDNVVTIPTMQNQIGAHTTAIAAINTQLAAQLNQPVLTTSSPTFAGLSGLTSAAVDNAQTNYLAVNGTNAVVKNSTVIPALQASATTNAANIAANTTSINTINTTLAADLNQPVKTTSNVIFQNVQVTGTATQNANTIVCGIDGTGVLSNNTSLIPQVTGLSTLITANINQAVKTTSAPTFTGATLTGLATDQTQLALVALNGTNQLVVNNSFGSSTYTPTVSSSSGFTGIVMNKFLVVRMGNICSVSGAFTAGIANGTLGSISFTLPYNPTANFASTTDLSGCVQQFVAGVLVNNQLGMGSAYANVGALTGNLSWNHGPAGGGTYAFTCVFNYKIA